MAKRNSYGKSNFTLVLTHLGALFTICCWGFSFVATKEVMSPEVTTQPLSPTEAYLYRFVIAYLLIWLFCHARMWCNNLRDEALMLLCGMTSGSIYFIAENTALEFTYASNVSLLTSTSPLVTVLLIGLLYKSEKPGKGIIIGSLVAFIGMGCVIFNSATSIDVRPVGDLLSIAAAFTWAIYSLVVKKLNVVYDAMFITRKTFFYGLITALPFLLFEPELRNPVDVITCGWPMVDMSLIFLALFPSVIAFYLWAIAIKYLGPIAANNYMYLQPVVTVIASVLLLGERVSALGFFGFFLILFGLWLGYYLDKRPGFRRR